MFMGEYDHTIDVKGRVIIPSKFREDLSGEFVITAGLDGCLFVYPMVEWERFIDELKRLPGSKEVRQLQRYFMAGAAACDMDKQGRVLIPNKLREHGEIEKDVVLVGVINKIEIWSQERWNSNNNYEDVDQIAEKMAEFGLSF
ncbi:MAG TPA: division/cell wall cluster transcriptional repressor MraZ [Clostridiales bacterium]|nr:division/cell wall cluster transcriptional repressor MraZ [Clostridiales bacterium]